MGREPANSASSTPHPCPCSLMNYSLSRYKLCSLAQTSFRVYAAVCVFKHPLPTTTNITTTSLCFSSNTPPIQPRPCCWVTLIETAGLTPDNRWPHLWCMVTRDDDAFAYIHINEMLFTQLGVSAHLIMFFWVVFFKSKEHFFKGIWATVFFWTC